TTTGSDDLVAINQSTFYYSLSTLDNITLNGTLDMSQFFVTVAILGGLTLNTDLTLSGYGASLEFKDNNPQTVSAGSLVSSATIHLTGYYAELYSYRNQTVTFASNLTISSESGSAHYIRGQVDNQGTIQQIGSGSLSINFDDAFPGNYSVPLSWTN